MNTCAKCDALIESERNLCNDCYDEGLNHIRYLINPQPSKNRRTGIRTSVILITLAIALAWWSYAHANTLDNASIHVQAMRNGLPLASTEYQLLSDNGLIAGHTDADGMVRASGIVPGAWTLAVGCARAIVYAAEVQGQVIQQVDASCLVWLPGVKN